MAHTCVKCVGAKGFGDPQAKARTPGKQVAKDARQLGARQRKGSARPIDPEEASRGKLDVVRVKDWGSGKASDLGDLKIASASTLWQGAAAAEPAATAPTPRSFYKQLAQELQLAEAQGRMQVAGGGPVMPPFERWRFEERRYKQYLSDMLVVHCALDAALATADLHDTGLSSAFGALRCLGAGAGLSRTQALQMDLQALLQQQAPAAAAAAEAAAPLAAARKEQRPTQQQQQHARVVASAGAAQDRPAPSGNATALAHHLHQLGVMAAAATVEPGERDAAALQLLANAYSLYISLLSGGVRVGAAATEQLRLFERGAVALYTSYPVLAPGQDPVQVLSAAVDAAGELLSAAQREDVVAHLPRAFVKAGLMLSALAHED